MKRSQGVHEQPPAVPQKMQPPLADALWRPWLLAGMTAILVARPLFPSEAVGRGDGLPIVMLWLMLGVLCLLAAVGLGRFSLRFGWIDAAVLLLIGWHTAAALWAVANASPRPAINSLWEWIGLGTCFFLARQLIVSPREARAVVAVMACLAVAVSTYGLYQYAYELPHTRANYAADPERALHEAGMSFPPHSPERKLFEDRLANTEPMATFALTNSLAGFLAAWLVMSAGIVLSDIVVGGGGGSGGAQNRRRAAGMAILLIPIVLCLLTTKSRSGYAGACAGLLAAWWLSRRRRFRIGWKLPAVAMGVVLLATSAAVLVEGPSVLGRATKSLGYRLQYWQASARMIADHPWLGCGPGNFQDFYTQYKLPEASEEIADPHNFLLEIWATAGTPAATAFLCVLGCFVWSISRGEGRGAGGEERGSVASGQCKTASGINPKSNPQSPIPNPQSPVSRPQSPIPQSPNPQIPISDAWLHVLAGGLAGFLLSLPMGMLSAAPPGIMPVLLGLPAAAVAAWLLLGWIREGQMPRWLPAVGAAALLIDLLAAGGIGFPGVAGTFWLLLALGLHQGSPFRAFRSFVAWMVLAAAVGLAAACYATAYRPTLNCQAELRLADLRLAEHNPDRAIVHLAAAAAADPLSVEAWQRLAEARFETWQQQPSRENFDGFQEADANMVRLAPHSASIWANSGQWYLEASAAPNIQNSNGGEFARAAIGRAVAAFGRAVQLYPTSANIHAKLAEVYAAAGDRAAFRREAETALRLDAVTPHADKKLPDDVRKELIRDTAK